MAWEFPGIVFRGETFVFAASVPGEVNEVRLDIQ